VARYQQRMARYSALTITDPLILYENKIANGTLLRDESQHRAAIELQKLYNRVKDYNPPVNFRQKIKELSLALEENERRQEEEAAKDPKKQVRSKSLVPCQRGKSRTDQAAIRRGRAFELQFTPRPVVAWWGRMR